MGRSSTRAATSTFLVERYWPGISEATLGEAQQRLDAAAEGLRREGIRVRCVSSILIPKEESVFSLIEAPSKEDVAEANRRAEVPFARILEVKTVAAAARGRRSS